MLGRPVECMHSQYKILMFTLYLNLTSSKCSCQSTSEQTRVENLDFIFFATCCNHGDKRYVIKWWYLSDAWVKLDLDWPSNMWEHGEAYNDKINQQMWKRVFEEGRSMHKTDTCINYTQDYYRSSDIIFDWCISGNTQMLSQL